MRYQNSCLDESFLFHPKKIFLGTGVVWNSPLNFGGDFQNAPISIFSTRGVQKSKIKASLKNKKIPQNGTTTFFDSPQFWRQFFDFFCLFGLPMVQNVEKSGFWGVLGF